MKFEDLSYCIYSKDVCSKVNMVYDIIPGWMICYSSDAKCKHYRSCKEHVGFYRCFK